LHQEGLVEADQPGSTRALSDFALFNTPSKISTLSTDLAHSSSFPKAHDFFSNAIKLPVWAFDDEAPMVEAYCAGLAKVCKAVEHSPTDFLTTKEILWK
jgi:hypothetical protein